MRMISDSVSPELMLYCDTPLSNVSSFANKWSPEVNVKQFQQKPSSPQLNAGIPKSHHIHTRSESLLGSSEDHLVQRWPAGTVQENVVQIE